ncbi:hypothetical protein [Actibacterium sp. 188UL27-1]|uniref:hypothetical protein n=1 Tax=Actibacterium sp. 188UL27-1 TaxID=2786961 RepID=UPI001958B523|nr:hypothetical protein [Actibacterium sp. 188UL27-1]MBM7069237.1 hypothetical protein [Actibacterium sp. 188UL27-1]
MHILLGVLAAAGALYFWLSRARDAAHATRELTDMATDVLGAARRFGFRRRADQHPVESIDEERLAGSALAIAFLEMGKFPTEEQKQTLLRSVQSTYGMDKPAAEEAMILGHWLVSECGTIDAAVSRLAKKLLRLGGQDALNPVLEMVKGFTGDAGLSDKQTDAVQEVARIFRRTGRS